MFGKKQEEYQACMVALEKAQAGWTEERRVRLAAKRQIDGLLREMHEKNCETGVLREEVNSLCLRLERLQKTNRVLNESRPSNPHRTEEGLHICECCGVVYKPAATKQRSLERVYGVILDEYTPLHRGRQHKKPATDLLLQPVNSGRFCPDCEETMQEELEVLKYFLSADTEDVQACRDLRQSVYHAKNMKEEGKS